MATEDTEVTDTTRAEDDEDESWSAPLDACNLAVSGEACAHLAAWVLAAAMSKPSPTNQMASAKVRCPRIREESLVNNGKGTQTTS